MVSHVVQAVAIPGAHGTLITSRVGNDGQGSTGKMEGPAKTPISLQPRARPLEHMGSVRRNTIMHTRDLNILSQQIYLKSITIISHMTDAQPRLPYIYLWS